MAINPFAWGRKDTQEDDKRLFSAAVFSSRAPALLNEEKALSIPAVKASIELITSSISSLPIYLHVENDEGIEKVEDDRISVLNHEANNYDTAQVLKKKIVQDYLLRGKAYLYRKNGQLYHLEAKNVQEEPYTEDNITVAYKEFVYNGTATVTLQENEVIVIDSGTNGLLTDSGKLFNTAYEQLNYQESLLMNSAVPVGMLKSASRLTENVINRLRVSFESLYGGAKKAGRTMILEEGLDYESLSLKPDEMQLTETNKHTLSEIARVFNIPESLLNSQANKYNSLEANNVSFLQNTLSPIITAIEAAFDKNLLTQVEKDLGFFFRFDTSEILRTTEEIKVKTTAEAFQKGLISFNDARFRLDLPKAEKDYHLLSTGTVVKYSDGSFHYPNLGPQEKQPEVKSSNE